MRNLKIRFVSAVLGSAMTAITSPVSAAPMTYTFDVTVVEVIEVGINPVYNFGTSIPPSQTFTGTFTTDDTGEFISDLQITIGGVDVASAYPSAGGLLFDQLGWNYKAANTSGAACCAPGESTIELGFELGIDVGSFAVHFPTTGLPGIIWTGTASAARLVPEPGTLLLLATGLLGLTGYRWQQRRREGTQVG